MSINALTGEIPDGPELTPLQREKARADVAESDLVLCEEEIRSLRRSLAAVKAENAKRFEESPKGKLARLVARYYVQRLGKNAKTWKFGDKRQKSVLARLKEDYDPLYICRAIDGLAVGYHTNPDTGAKYDDLELVCRDEVKLERFHQLAEANDAATLITPEWRRLLIAEDHATPTDRIGSGDDLI